MKRKVIRGKLQWVKEASVDKEGGNKKIKNATKVEYDGIKFRSKLEAYTYKKLKESGLVAQYETETFTLLEPFEYNGEKIRAMTYTPDFILNDFIIECKGFANESFPLKCKFFKKLLVTNNDKRVYLVVKNQKEVNECINKIIEHYEKLKQNIENNITNNTDLKFLYWD